MSTHKFFDRICVVVLAVAIILTVLFINGEKLGIKVISDEDSESNEGDTYFTENDLDGDWDTSGATVIKLNGDTAKVNGDGAYVNGNSVVISNSGKFTVSGNLSNGNITVDANDNSKVFIMLCGVNINCDDSAAICVDNAEKVFLTLKKGTENTVTSGSEYNSTALNDNIDGAVFSHDDLTINGSGTLSVTAGYKHGIAVNDTLIITGGSITVNSATDGLRANDRLNIKSATVTVNSSDDGIVVAKEEGELYIESGTFNITSEDDGIHTGSDITVKGGTFEISAEDDGIHSDTSVVIEDGTINISKCYEGIEAPNVEIKDGDITIYSEDDGINANGGSAMGMGGAGGQDVQNGMQDGNAIENQQGSGNNTENGTTTTPPEIPSGDNTTSDNKPTMPSGGQGNMTPPGNQGGQNETSGSTGGTTPPGGQNPPGGTKGGNAQGGEAQKPGSKTTSGLTPTANTEIQSAEASYAQMPDDPKTLTETTSSDNEIPTVKISGGRLTIVNQNGRDADGIDSNGDIIISGGEVYISLSGSGSNCALDYGSESGGTCKINGGIVVASGGSSMIEEMSGDSAQASILCTTSNTSDNTDITVKNSDGETVLDYEVPLGFSAVIISCPEIKVDNTYTVSFGNMTENITVSQIATQYGSAGNMSSMQGNIQQGDMQQGNSEQGTMQKPDDANNSTDNGNTTTPRKSGDFGTEAQDKSSTPQKPDGVSTDTDMNGKASKKDDKTVVEEESAENESDDTTEEFELSSSGKAMLALSIVVLVGGIAIAFLYKKKS